ncbi:MULTISPECIES: hypothetical protein [unclassified Agrococcus]|uniref:hypothetical protein n=1 Tax=unclassified Agrococcus TaxID=2615065 RepID=UPI00360C2F1A
MPTITTRALRGSAVAALAMVGVLGLAACSGGADEEPTTSETAAAEESAEPTTSDAPEETEASAEGGLCTAEQLSTISSTDFPEAALSQASATFAPAGVVDGLPTVCVATFEAAGTSASYAVLSGGAATLAALVEQGTAAGGQLTDAGGTVVGTVGDATIAAQGLTALTEGTAGFENVEDLLVVIATPGLG